MLTNLRQHQAIRGSIAALREATAATTEGMPHEVVLLDLHRGLRDLDGLTGVTTTDDVLRQIFSTFCIGK